MVTRAWAAAAGVALGACIWSGTASATDKPPSNVPAIAQYIESQPTLAGPQAGTAGTAGTTPVPAAVARAIAKYGGADKAALTNLAASGPPSALTPAATRRGVSAPRGTALGAVFESAGISYGNAILLGGLLVLISLACGAAAARRRTPPPLNP